MAEIDPISYPTVTLDGQNYEVKFRVGDILRLRKDGVQIGQLNKDTFAGADGLEIALKLLSAGLAHAITLTPEQLGDKIELADFAVYTAAVVNALGKVSARSKALLDAMPKPAAQTPDPGPKPN